MNNVNIEAAYKGLKLTSNTITNWDEFEKEKKRVKLAWRKLINQFHPDSPGGGVETISQIVNNSKNELDTYFSIVEAQLEAKKEHTRDGFGMKNYH